MRTFREKKPPLALRVEQLQNSGAQHGGYSSSGMDPGEGDAHPIASYPPPFLWGSAGDPYKVKVRT